MSTEDIFVRTPSKKEFNSLMLLLEKNGGSWRLNNGSLTSTNSWKHHGKETCIHINGNIIDYCNTTSYRNKNKNVIGLSEYFSKIGITLDQMNEMETYFSQKTPAIAESWNILS